MAKRAERRRRKNRPLRRRVAVRKPKRTFLVFCEGKRTEPDYLMALREEPAVREAASVEIKIDLDASGAVPSTLVDAAAEARARNSEEQGEIDEVWCLFDVEWPRNHPRLPEAKAKAQRSDVRLAISNPCFELWLALHFENRTARLDSTAADTLRRNHDGSPDKGLDGTQYMPRRAAAVRRARALTKKHERDRTEFPNDNPSSGMYLFLEAVESSW
ncbi:MAG: RloB domain-containing protein [Acidobacteria bacterium]|nr:RloB domain-containing protein [Acidobacteriota bacterium]MYJ04786.1 RloB domain-containing protein [Acidobacteriota bacterium]